MISPVLRLKTANLHADEGVPCLVVVERGADVRVAVPVGDLEPVARLRLGDGDPARLEVWALLQRGGGQCLEVGHRQGEFEVAADGERVVEGAELPAQVGPREGDGGPPLPELRSCGVEFRPGHDEVGGPEFP